jgi:hypothetical protein
VVQIDNEGHVTPIHVRLEVPGHWIMAGMSEEYEGGRCHMRMHPVPFRVPSIDDEAAPPQVM